MAMIAGCGVTGPQGLDDEDPTGQGIDGPAVGAGAGASTAATNGSGGSGAQLGPTSGAGAGHHTGGAPNSTSGQSSSQSNASSQMSSSTTTQTVSSSGNGQGGSGGSGGNGCYTEGWNPINPLGDLQSAYNQGQWLDYMLATLDRRYANGFALMDEMRNDPWLQNNFPSYFNLGSWSSMIESIDTACHEETHGWDFDTALSYPGEHVYFMGDNLHVRAPELGFFARNVILSAVQAGGSVTSNYDSTYLTGTQGSYDFIFLADELTAYINGLACATAVGDHIAGAGYSYRDGAASHLYYLQIYLGVARTQYPTLYNTWKNSADWQTFVRFSWARGHFWTNESMIYANLGINDAAIWSRINQPQNLQEIQLFTGDDPSTVACSP